MGYNIFQVQSQVVIRSENTEAALRAIKSLKGRETAGRIGEMHFMWLRDSDEFMSANTLVEALRVWRWPIVETDSKGTILDLEFIGEKYGNEDLLFEILAPYVKAGSYILMAGEDGVVWRWYFTGKLVQKQYGRVVFDSQAEVETQRILHRKEWPHNLP